MTSAPILLAGPTAVGKTAVAVAVAERVGGEVISADSMQVYRGLDIGTAKPTPDERARVRHHGVDVVGLESAFDAAAFVRMATDAVAEIGARGRVPILCGGTGLYLNAFLNGLGSSPAPDPVLRAALESTPLPELLDEPIAIEDRPHARLWTEGQGTVAFRDVHFAYMPGTPILRGVSFAIEAGEFVAIAGGSGSGKSTLLNLVPRFFEVTAGAVLVDDHDVPDFTLASLRKEIGYVGQDNSLFDGSVEENLRYGRPDASSDEVIAAARAANAHDFILDLPDQYQTRVGQNGVKLSGGQRQRLSLARAFLTQPRILLLDEPTASVEPESEALIHASILERTRDGRGTTLLVTHRVDLLRQAARILFLEGGRLIADGRHSDLVLTCPEYADAYHRWEVKEEAGAGRAGDGEFENLL